MGLIDANKLWKSFDEVGLFDGGNPRHIAQQTVEEQPTVDAVEVVHGRWEDVALRFTQTKEKCSVCGGIVYAHGYNYCPNCGAKMDGERKDNE